MINRTILPVTLSLLLGLTPAFPAIAQPNSPLFNLSTQTNESLDSIQQKLKQSNIIYLGETHDSAADHQAQLEIIQTLHQQNPQVAIALEMIQRPYQSALDRYIAGSITEAELLAQTEYKKRWGFPWELYAPIFRYAQTHRIPLIALNTPAEVTRKVARQGFASLTRPDRRWIPPISAIEQGPDSYRQRLRQLFDGMHQGHGRSLNFDYFFQAQVLWDETMADRLTHSLQQFPDRQIIVLVGQGHLLYGEGIPRRVNRRRPQTTQTTILLNPDPTFRTANASTPPIADYFWDTAGSK